MRIKKKNVARLASLSALGVGALGVAAGSAEAGTIHSTTLGVTVGQGGAGSAIFSLPGSLTFKIFYAVSHPMSNTTLWMVNVAPRAHVRFGGVPSYFLNMVGSGKKWGTGGTVAALNSGVIARRVAVNTPYFATNAIRGIGDGYLLFNFDAAGGTEYGWLQLSVTGSEFSGPTVTLSSMAYDDGGQKIAAGDAGTAATPEPASMALSGLGALVLGAAGLRRWRVARKTAA